MNKKNTKLILLLFLLGIFIGAVDSGIITPARELIQKGFDISDSASTWMITLYTLIYAVSMPIIGKMADRYSYKKVYVFGITLFGLGSMLCGLSNFYGTFSFFLCARVIQAIGAGGIMPIANAVIGRSFPEEKRGTALGMVGAVYGIATIIGPTLGSSILDAAGTENWGWVFFINIPICLAIIILSMFMKDPKHSERSEKSVDILGSIFIAAVVGSLMYALTNLNFFHFVTSIKEKNVYPFLIIFVILLPLFVMIEKRAKDPVLDMRFFQNRQMIVILILAFIVGIGMMGMVFVPQFSENVLKIKAGKGGYLVTLLAVFSGIAAPVSGKLLDKKGAKLVLLLGFIFTITGTLFLGYAATKALNFATVLIGLALMGFGVGFTMGAPLNYLVLQSIPSGEDASALATMSLIRSIGVTISPSIMIGFISDAGSKVQGNIISALHLNMPNISGASSKTFEILKNSDVTTIFDNLMKALKSIPQIPPQALIILKDARSTIEKSFQTTMNAGYTHMFTAAAIIAAIGILVTLFLKNKSTSVN